MMRRPRLYRDREWIGGYAAVASKLPEYRAQPWRIRERIYAIRTLSEQRRLTAWESGALDAMLDAFGC